MFSLCPPLRGCTPSQVRTGGYPIQDQGGGTPSRTRWGTPIRTGWGTPPPVRRQISTCYAAGGMPLAFTQEDFLVFKILFHKKVLLRERKRHTTCCIAVASACYSGGGYPNYPPDLGWGTPPPRPGMEYPPYLDLGWSTPPRCEQTETITFPHPLDGGR